MRRTTKRSGLVIGIDLGGTNMQIGVVDGRNRIIGRDRRKTMAREGFAKTLERIVDGVDAACADAGVSRREIAAVGIAAPGAIDIPRGIVLAAPNLRWTNAPLRAALSKKLRRPVVLDNDVNGAVWGEFKLGAGRKVQSPKSKVQKSADVLGVWLGTGVGGGLVLDGKLFHGAFFTAGEIGQTVLFPQGKKGRRILEDFCSRTGISRTVGLRLKDFPRSFLKPHARGGARIIDSAILADAYLAKDALAVEVIDEAAELLGVAIANWVTVLAVDTVIIGGGVTEVLGEPFLKRLRASFAKDVFPPRSRAARIIMTTLKDDAGLLGAALLARES